MHAVPRLTSDERRGTAEQLKQSWPSPIFNDRDEVVAAVYGVRSPGLKNQRVGVRHLEAQLTQLLAETMTVGLERQRREAEAARTRILLEQAFSPELASQLQRNPSCSKGTSGKSPSCFRTSAASSKSRSGSARTKPTASSAT